MTDRPPDSAGAASGGGTLYVVATPIGNLGDMTARAIEVLTSVALVLAEDTRRTRVLLDHYAIHTPSAPYHEHNEARETPRLVARLAAGEAMALVSDAGTPLLSDPGARLVDAAVAAGVRVVPIPGASALLAALVAAGLPTARFTFLGFLPRRGGERAAAIADVVASPRTVILYEAPPRAHATLQALASAGAGERRCVLARELTKLHEEFVRGSVRDVAAHVAAHPPRGELVLAIEGRAPSPPDTDAARERAATLRDRGASVRDVARALTDELGLPRNVAYAIAREGAAGGAADPTPPAGGSAAADTPGD